MQGLSWACIVLLDRPLCSQTVCVWLLVEWGVGGGSMPATTPAASLLPGHSHKAESRSPGCEHQARMDQNHSGPTRALLHRHACNVALTYSRVTTFVDSINFRAETVSPRKSRMSGTGVPNKVGETPRSRWGQCNRHIADVMEHIQVEQERWDPHTALCHL